MVIIGVELLHESCKVYHIVTPVVYRPNYSTIVHRRFRANELNLDPSRQLSVQTTLDNKFHDAAADAKITTSEQWRQACDENRLSIIAVVFFSRQLPQLPA